MGLAPFEQVLDEELSAVASGRGKFKAVRGDYGTGKTFFASWLEHRARQRGFATTLVQISESDTPLYRMETVYRRAIESLQTKEWSQGAFRSLVDRWFYNLEEEVLASAGDTAQDAEAVGRGGRRAARATARVCERDPASVRCRAPTIPHGTSERTSTRSPRAWSRG